METSGLPLGSGVPGAHGTAVHGSGGGGMPFPPSSHPSSADCSSSSAPAWATKLQSRPMGTRSRRRYPPGAEPSEKQAGPRGPHPRR